jgi:hypothetical protein
MRQGFVRGGGLITLVLMLATGCANGGGQFGQDLSQNRVNDDKAAEGRRDERIVDSAAPVAASGPMSSWSQGHRPRLVPAT